MPATSTTLARDLGENSGIASYHLRLLAEHDFVRCGRRPGRTAWRASGGSAPPARPWASGVAGPGSWVLGRTALTLTRDEAVQFIAGQQELIRRFQRDSADAPPGARTVVFASLTYPEPAPDEADGTGPGTHHRPSERAAEH